MKLNYHSIPSKILCYRPVFIATPLEGHIATLLADFRRTNKKPRHKAGVLKTNEK